MADRGVPQGRQVDFHLPFPTSEIALGRLVCGKSTCHP
ncbi:MAG: hypothetical protein H6Q59_3340 [Firmicutes bacterium]|nr:hypothetical protein [Bacillota bacterium]